MANLSKSACCINYVILNSSECFQSHVLGPCSSAVGRWKMVKKLKRHKKVIPIGHKFPYMYFRQYGLVSYGTDMISGCTVLWYFLLWLNTCGKNVKYFAHQPESKVWVMLHRLLASTSSPNLLTGLYPLWPLKNPYKNTDKLVYIRCSYTLCLTQVDGGTLEHFSES